MLDLNSVPDDLLDPVVRVLDAALPEVQNIGPRDVMVIGAAARDILHSALGHRFATSATHDLDLALALSSWDAFSTLAAAFPRLGNTGLRFLGVTVDLLPFGGIENPAGSAQPPTRAEPFSVWAFKEILTAARPLELPNGATVNIPTVAGYASAKVGAWLDRSEWREAKDAGDLALVSHWYSESAAVEARPYETEAGNAALVAEEADVARAAARLLGSDVVATIGPDRQAELRARWPGNLELLIHDFVVTGQAAHNEARRRGIIDALTAGMCVSVS